METFYLIYIAAFAVSALVVYKMKAIPQEIKAKIRRIGKKPVKLRGRFVTWSAKSIMAPTYHEMKRGGTNFNSSKLAFEYENGKIVSDYGKTYSILPQKIRESDSEILSFKGDFVSTDRVTMTVYTALDMAAYSSDTILSIIIANRELGRNEIDAEVWINADNPKEYIVVSFLNRKARWVLRKSSNGYYAVH